jgi:molecular chaperone GrpE
MEVNSDEINYEKEAKEIEEKVKKLKEKLKKCLEEKSKYLEGWQRERAAFLNYKKEEEGRIDSLAELKKERIFKEILKILDNFEEALKNLPKELKDHPWIKGILQIKEGMLKILENEGVREIETKIGDNFDPNIHEAVEIGEGEEGKILQIFQKGFLWKGKVFRPAKVKVGKSNKK